MPIITGAVVAPPPVEPPPPVVLPEIGFASATYIDPTGTVWPLTDTSEDRGWFTLSDGVAGLGAAPMELTKDAYPRGGSRLRHAQAQSRTVLWALYVFGATHVEFLERWRALARAFTRTLAEGPGTLEIARPDGSRRRIAVYYEGGFEGRSQQGSGIASDAAVLSLYCEDPYWTDPTAVSERREYGGGVDYLNPYPTVSSGQVLGATTLFNPGDVTAWPTWTVTGPASAITMTNNTSGKTFILTPSLTGHGNLLTGEQVTVQTNPTRVRYQNGDVWTGALNWPAAQIWGLEPGTNDITFTLAGSGPGSAVDVSFMALYQTA